MGNRRVEWSEKAYTIYKYMQVLDTPVRIGSLYELLSDEFDMKSVASFYPLLWGLEFAGAIKVEQPAEVDHYTTMFSRDYVVSLVKDEDEDEDESEDRYEALNVEYVDSVQAIIEASHDDYVIELELSQLMSLLDVATKLVEVDAVITNAAFYSEDDERLSWVEVDRQDWDSEPLVRFNPMRSKAESGA